MGPGAGARELCSTVERGEAGYPRRAQSALWRRDRAVRVVVLASGRGSNLRALARAADRAAGAFEIVAVVSDRRRSEALAFARSRGAGTAVVRPRDHGDRETWDVALAEAVAAFEPDLVVLAGFMRLVGPAMLRAFEGAILNVHPSLLPAFPGLHAPQQAIEARAPVSGCTVHLVDAGMDTGRVLAQREVPIRAGDDAASLHLRIQAVEHELLPEVVLALSKARAEDPHP